MRRRVKLAFMVNDSARKITYTKRKKSLIKKIDEITTLCGIEACAIVYSDFHSEPEIWPSPWEVQRVVTKFRSYSDFEKGKKMLNQESFLMQRIVKSQEQLAKLQKSNWEVEKSLILFQCLGKENFIDTLNTNALNDLAYDINEKLEKVTSKMNELDTNITN
ncbi:agamous-like MADS-box protein AGL80 [Vicia villosa]|uniref:agamous-like MADS-box protein AGL80 n=1 Tax=Vicia villosa TaxID=3911 RepID=UPI00273C1AA2|nr:agamous-like MADS-box protein AGL80 [Vicia villosa]XP_058783778.1 agamous-like MADS-box protein AGL80 [Vicia villosa]